MLFKEFAMTSLQDVEEWLEETATTTDDFIDCEGYFSPPSEWDEFHDYWCDLFKNDEEYQKFANWVEGMAKKHDFPDCDEPEDINEAGWYAWRTSRGI